MTEAGFPRPSIPVDTRWREFTVGGLALLLGDDPFTYDKVVIEAIADGSLTVTAGGVTLDWSQGASIYPLRRARLEQESASSALTNRVGQGTLLFELNQANDIADEGEWDSLFGDYPILFDKPNRREVIDLTFARNSLALDNEHGLIEVGDAAGRAFTVQTYMRMMRGREGHYTFRQFLYRLRGQQAGVWLPTYNRDFELSQAALAADTKLDVKKIGYAYTGGAVSGRTAILVGSTPAEITGTGAAPSTAEERLNLSGAIGEEFAAGTFGSFMDTCRLSGDDVEIMHHTDTDGVAECQLAFRAFRDEREAPAVLDYPIPAAVEEEEACGTPADSCEPEVPEEEGYWFRLHFEWTHGDDIPIQSPGINTEFFLGGVEVGFLNAVGGYVSHEFAGDSCIGTTLTAWDTITGPEDPHNVGGKPNFLNSGYPDELWIRVQFQSGSFLGGNIINSHLGKGRVYMQLPGGPMVPMLVTEAEIPPTGVYTFQINNLWPRDYTLVPVL
jgi:hypothetical protein